VETFKEKKKKVDRMNCATNRLIPKWNSPDNGKSWTENHLHSGRKPTCRTNMMGPLKWQTQHFIRIMSPPSFFALNWRPTCWYVAQQMTKWCSVLFQQVWLQTIYIHIFC